MAPNEETPPERDELALPDFAHLPLGTLPMRIAPLTEKQVNELLEYERAHANRLPVIVVLEGRVSALQAGATPSGSIAAETPEVEHTQHGSKVDGASAKQVDTGSLGGPMNPNQPFA